MKKNEAMLRAADLTARQLRQAIEIVEGKLGAECAQQGGPLIGAVLMTLVENYRQKPK